MQLGTITKLDLIAKLTNYPNISNWVNRLDDNITIEAEMMDKIDDLLQNDPAKFDRLEIVYKNIKATSGDKGKGNFTVQIGTVNVYYDNNGFPDFRLHSPKIGGINIVYTPTSTLLTGGGTDMTAANNWAKTQFSTTDFTTNSNGTCNIKDAQGNFILCTWHHHQDGKTMFPVPSSLHNVGSGGAAHSGGKVIINNDLQGFFSSPIF